MLARILIILLSLHAFKSLANSHDVARECLRTLEEDPSQRPFRMQTPRLPGVLGVLQPILEPPLRVPYMRSLVENSANKHRGRPELFFKGILEEGDLGYQTYYQKDSRGLPEQGAAVVVANHPFGFVDTVVIADFVAQQRSDVKILANQMIKNSVPPEVQDMLITVDLNSPRSSQRQEIVQKSKDHLENGGVIIIFPAGLVALPLQVGEDSIVIDPPWKVGASSMVEGLSGVPVVPIFMPGQNSSTYYQYGDMFNGWGRKAMFARELYNRRGSTIDIIVGRPVSSDVINGFGSSPAGLRASSAFLKVLTYSLSMELPEASSGNLYDIQGYFREQPEFMEGSLTQPLVRQRFLHEAIRNGFLDQQVATEVPAPQPASIAPTPFDNEIRRLAQASESLEHLNDILIMLGQTILEN